MQSVALRSDVNGVALFARTRRWRTACICILVAAGLVLVCGPLAVSLSPTGDALVRVALLVPLLPALAIAASLVTPLRTQERVGSRMLRRLELTHLLAFTALTIALVGGASLLFPSRMGADPSMDQGSIAVVRNILALTGTATVSYRISGTQLGWVLPVVWTILPPLLIPRADQDRSEIFTLLTQPDSAFTAFVVASVVWLAGAFLIARWSPDRR